MQKWQIIISQFEVMCLQQKKSVRWIFVIFTIDIKAELWQALGEYNDKIGESWYDNHYVKESEDNDSFMLPDCAREINQKHKITRILVKS